MSKILNVPYKSQFDADATGKHSDCGPCCVAMLLGALGQETPVQAILVASGATEETGMSKEEIVAGAKAYGLEMTWQTSTLDELKGCIDNGQAPLVLLQYGNLPDRHDQEYTGGYYVVVVGYDDAAGHVFVNDPNYPVGSTAGYQHAYPYPVFLQAWGGFSSIGAEADFNFYTIVPHPAQPIPGIAIAGQLAPVAGLSDLWVKRPAGLRLHDAPSAPPGLAVLYGQHLRALAPESVPDTQGRVWLQVRTDQGITGWVVAQDSQRYLATERPPEANRLEVLDTPPAQAGLKVLEAPPAGAALDQLKAGERIVVYDRLETDGAVWLYVKSPRSKYGWIREQVDGVTLVGAVTQETDGLDVSFATGIGDLWVVAPLGLTLRTQLGTPAGPGAPAVKFGEHLRALAPEAAPDARGIAWQQVSTDGGVTAWGPVTQGSDRYLADKPPEGPYTAQVLDTPPVRNAGGLSVRDNRDINSPLLDQIQIGEFFTVYVHLPTPDGTPWLWIQSPRGKYGWSREKADGVTLISKSDKRVTITPPAPATPSVNVNPFGKCLVGLGTANPWPLQDPDYGVIATGRIELVKVLAPSRQAPGQGAQDVKRLMREGKVVMGRLFEKPADRRMAAREFFDSVIEGFEELYSVGVRYFELHNEPNLPHDGLGVSWANGTEFGAWFMEAFNLLKARHADALIGYPGLSPQFNNPGLPAEAETWKFLDGSDAAARQADWIGVHCYWQNEGDGHWAMLSELDGMLWKKFRARYPNKPIFITEFSNNGRQNDYALKGDQYGRYLALLRHEVNLAGAIAFALYWPGQDANREGWRLDRGGTAIAQKVGEAVGRL